MTPAEIGWRAANSIRARLQSRGFGVIRRVPEPDRVEAGAWGAKWPLSVEASAYRVAADRILAGHWEVLGIADANLGFPPRWNRDPKTGTEAPLRFGKTINYRDKQVVGEIKYLWEPNRHLELVTLAQAWRLTGQACYADGVKQLLESWFDQCPYPRGVNWSSSLELAVRLVNWAVAWQLLDGERSPLFRDAAGRAFRLRWVQAVYQHCYFISGHFSRHSSANNHLFGELMGVFIAGTTWPLWPQMRSWRDECRRELETQALLQNAPDGVNREQAFYYHHEVADMMLLCWRFAEANALVFSSEFKERLEAMLVFIASIMDVAGHVPMVGDADDAVMVRFSREAGFCPYRSLLASGAVLFSRADFAAKAKTFDDKSRWLLGDGAKAHFDALLAQHQDFKPRCVFPDGGYYVLGSDFETPAEIRLLADAGPLGYLGIAAHGHADALSFTLSIGGIEFLVDPGTYTYQGDSDWRDHFRGTAAHNTVRIDEQDQSKSGGTFMWVHKARTRCISFTSTCEEDVLIAEHDGYRRLTDPLTHRREIRLEKNGRVVTVIDQLLGHGVHVAEWYWHFSESNQVTLERNRVYVEDSGFRMEVEFDDVEQEVVILNGQTEPTGGWVSRSYQSMTASNTVRCRSSVHGQTTRMTRFILSVPIQ